MQENIPEVSHLVLEEKSPEATNGWLTGGKGSNLAKLVNIVGSDHVPPAIFVTTKFSGLLLEKAGIKELVAKLDDLLPHGKEKEAEKVAEEIRSRIEGLRIPKGLQDVLLKELEQLKAKALKKRVAVRSSGITEDLPQAAFAGQFESYLNVPLGDEVLEYILKCLASAYLWRIVHYRQNLRAQGMLKISEKELLQSGQMAVIIQAMVDSEKSGVAFSIDPDTGNRNVGVIQAIYGLGEMLVQGKENASWTAFAKVPSVKILGTISRAPQKEMEIYDAKTRKNAIVPVGQRDPRVITITEAQQLAETVKKIEEAYGQPMDIEYAMEGGKIYIVQARGETVHTAKASITIHKLKESPKAPPVARGIAVGTKITFGPVVLAKDHLEARRKVEESSKRNERPILVTSMTTPDWEVIMDLSKVSGIITERGNRTSHAAIVSRERGIPCAVGVVGASRLPEGKVVTLDCSTGDAKIYDQVIQFEVQEVVPKNLPKTTTKVMVNIGTPDEALKVSQLPAEGSSLVRVEFIVTNAGLHPMFAIFADKIGYERWAPDVKEAFPNTTSLSKEYAERLKTGIAIVAAAFYPRRTIVRFSDFKTNEYGSLPGGIHYRITCNCGTSVSFEQLKNCPVCSSKEIKTERVQLELTESNPMMGHRGASRYIHKDFSPAFQLELEAFVAVHKLGFTNAIPMVPFVRTTIEAEKVTSMIKNAFIDAGLSMPEIIFMAEVPSVFFTPQLFAPYCNGFSIGSNDLTQLALGIDRDCETLAWEFNEADPAVMKAISMLSDSAHSFNPSKSVGICGQAPSDLGKEFIKFLTVHLDSIGVNPDKVVETLLQVSDIEAELRSMIALYDHKAPALAKALGTSDANAEFLIRKLSETK
jgi:pyruvate,water dikinase